MTARPNAHAVELTTAQTEVLTRIARGESQVRIAAEMHVAASTVRSHYREIYIRLGADNAPHAVALAIGLELLPADVATHHTTTITGGTTHAR